MTSHVVEVSSGVIGLVKVLSMAVPTVQNRWKNPEIATHLNVQVGIRHEITGKLFLIKLFLEQFV